MNLGTVSMHKHRQAAFSNPVLETGVKNLEFVSTPRWWCIHTGHTRLAS